MVALSGGSGWWRWEMALVVFCGGAGRYAGWWRWLVVWFFVCMLLHAWLGVRDVLRDYVPHLPSRWVLQAMVDIAVLGNALAVLWILFGMNV